MRRVRAALGLSREHLVALSIFTRNDYFDGVGGVGPRRVIRFLGGCPAPEVMGVREAERSHWSKREKFEMQRSHWSIF